MADFGRIPRRGWATRFGLPGCARGQVCLVAVRARGRRGCMQSSERGPGRWSLVSRLSSVLLLSTSLVVGSTGAALHVAAVRRRGSDARRRQRGRRDRSAPSRSARRPRRGPASRRRQRDRRGEPYACDPQRPDRQRQQREPQRQRRREPQQQRQRQREQRNINRGGDVNISRNTVVRPAARGYTRAPYAYGGRRYYSFTATPITATRRSGSASASIRSARWWRRWPRPRSR